MSRRLALIIVAAASIATVAVGCSRTPERPVASASPTAASLVNASVVSGMSMGLTGLDTGALIGPLGTPMPGRSEALVFRRALDTKYITTLGRSNTNVTYVDIEGDVVWIMEYLRYRVSGCDHGTAVQRVAAQIQGNPPGADCGGTPEGAVPFPARQDVLAFRRGLDDIYLQMGRGLIAGPVDIEGSVIFVSEYLRYRVNGCDAATSQQKVFDQIDGKGVSQTCYVPPACVFYFFGTPYPQVDPGAATFTQEVLKASGLSTCTWTAVSESSFITLTGDTTGADRGQFTYRVSQNFGLARTGQIRLTSSDGGVVFLLVYQRDRPFGTSIALFDYKEQTSSTRVCIIRNLGGGPTTCTLVATPALPEAATDYLWTVTYTYFGGVTRTMNVRDTSNTITFQESCNNEADSNGAGIDLNVSLTVTDSRGNTQTVSTGSGLQPTFQLRVMKCS